MSKKRVIFSDLDGTLLDVNYSFKRVRVALEILKEKEVPLILCSSKTKAEIEVYRKKLNNKHPFISENGGAIFIPVGYFGKEKIKPTRYKILTKGKYEIIKLGIPYKKLVEVMNELKKDFPIRGFSDMSAREIAKDSGLSTEQAKLSKKRDYDEAFILENKKLKKRLFSEIKKQGLKYTEGGKYFHILGDNDKGKAVEILSELYKKKYGKVKTISFGDADNDCSMLRATDESYFVKGPADLNKKIIKLLGFDKEIKRAERLYKSSVKILEKLQLGNGAVLASFPKSRYPYVYPRDHSICMIAFVEAGMLSRAKKALEFILKTQNNDGSFPQRVDKNGKDRSYKPIQLDNTALILYSFAKYIQTTSDKKFLNKNKKKIRKSVNYIKSQLDKKKNLFFTPNSVHEFPPLEEGLEIWVNAICYAALRELQKIGIKIDLNLERLRKTINRFFWNGKHFVKNIRLGGSSSVVIDIDSSAYALADFGVLEDDNHKVKKTVDEIEKELWHRKLGGICRYKKHIGRNNGGWGPWPHFTLMLCRHFIRLGRKRKADKYLNWVLDVAYREKLPEHISTKKDFEEWVRNYRSAGILRKDREIMIKNIRKNKMFKKGLAYSVLPLAWPHAEFIRTWLLYRERFLC